jgi:serine protease Do
MADRSARRLLIYCWGASICTLALCLWGLPAGAAASELRHSPIVKAVQRARPSVVNIRGEKTIASTTAPGAVSENAHRVNGMGTGVVIDPRGYIVTNYHVVDGVREIQVTLASEEKFVARLIARDLETDLAVIKIDCPEKLPVINVGTSSDLMPGETVIAVGNAFGYEHTVTNGIISALHRTVQVNDAQFYNDVIQTNAAINPGNSGGPLLNIDGEMIGVNVAVRAGAQNIAFAIPVDKVAGVAADLVAAYNARKGFHGLTLAKQPSAGEGVTVATVTADSPAAAAGIEPGDVVKQIGEVEIQRPLDFHRAMLEASPGEKFGLVIDRKHEKLTLNVTLAQSNLKEVGKEPRLVSQPAWDMLGLELKPIPLDEFRQTYQSTYYHGGLTVSSVRANSPAENQGIRPGDVLVGLHDRETISPENVAWILSRPDFAAMNPLKFYILRGNETRYGYIPVLVRKVSTQEEGTSGSGP